MYSVYRPYSSMLEVCFRISRLDAVKVAYILKLFIDVHILIFTLMLNIF